MSPVLVGFIRGLGLTAAAAAVSAVVIALTNPPDEIQRAWWAPFVLLGLRTFEGLIDKARGQAPQQPLGSAPVDPDWYQKNYMGE